LVSTDVDGRYELRELPAGRYQISVSKGSFVSQSYGQSRLFEPGKELEVLAGQTIEKVDFALSRGGVITGIVLDEFSEPVADVRVQAMRIQYVQGRKQLLPIGRASITDDVGEFRIFGLAPSRYFLSAMHGTAGGILNGLFAGSDNTASYAPTYFPRTPNIAEAEPLRVGAGEIISGLNIALIPIRTARISGTAMDSNGRPLSGSMVMAVQRIGLSVGGTASSQVRPDGSFTLSNIAPGDYVINAVTPGTVGVPSEFAMGVVTVTGDDVTGVQVVGQKSVSAIGRLILDPEAAKVLQPSTIRLSAMPAHPEEALLAGTGPARVNDDFTFEIKTQPGLALIRFASLPSGWGLTAVRLNGLDVTDTGIDFKPNQDVEGIEIELTNRPTEVSGVVTNARGEPVGDYSVVIFAKDRERWGYTSRFFQTGRPDQNGRFNVKALPAGEYYAAALDFVDPGEASDPEFLDRLTAGAVSLTVVDGESRILNLKISSLPGF
jgi:hypothetical protein